VAIQSCYVEGKLGFGTFVETLFVEALACLSINQAKYDEVGFFRFIHQG
jgi:hypothetical protein